jgi:adenosylmethionine-8-amino-7-oxononanoate aminotransferase
MNGKFTGRLNATHESVVRKNGLRHERLDHATGNIREVLCVGGACSEVFTGERLAQVLEPSFNMQREALEALKANKAAINLSNHTSAGIASNLDDFTASLAPHLPWCTEANTDWFISLQTEGASAVMAACDILMQLQFEDNNAMLSSNRRKIAVGARSYHGPGSTSLGSASPLGLKPINQITYPVPSLFAAATAEGGEVNGSSEELEARAISALNEWFDASAHEVAVLLVEPQWGSSQIGLLWPENVLRHLVKTAKERGIKVWLLLR